MEWIIFDLGGIVVPENSGLLLARVAQAMALPPEQLTESLRVHHDAVTRGERTLLQMYTSILDEFRLDASPEEILNLHLLSYREMSIDHDPEAVALIGQLKTICQVACLTNVEPEIATICRETGLFKYFHRVYLSINLGMKKPDKEIYQAVLRDLACPAQEVLFIDDRNENVEGARLTGMQALKFTDMRQLKRELRRLLPFHINPIPAPFKTP